MERRGAKVFSNLPKRGKRGARVNSLLFLPILDIECLQGMVGWRFQGEFTGDFEGDFKGNFDRDLKGE